MIIYLFVFIYCIHTSKHTHAMISRGKINELFGEIKDTEWAYDDYIITQKISYLSVAYQRELRINTFLASHLYDVLHPTVQSYLEPIPLDSEIQCESIDEAEYHQRVVAQLNTWLDFRMIPNIALRHLFVSDINHLINDTCPTHTHYDELPIVERAPITIYIPPTTHYRQTPPPVSIYNAETKQTNQILGIGIIKNCAKSFLVVVRQYSDNNELIGMIYTLNVCDLQTNPNFHNIMHELWKLGKFYIEKQN